MESDKSEVTQQQNKLVNIVETLVKTKAKGLIHEAGLCDCEQCYNDVCALALNSIKPLYITTYQGQMLSSLNTLDYGYQAMLTAEITKAIEKVRKNPKHD